jgi:hypothetical protein
VLVAASLLKVLEPVNNKVSVLLLVHRNARWRSQVLHEHADDPSMNFVCQFYVWIDGLARNSVTRLSAPAHFQFQFPDSDSAAAAPKARQRFH